MMVPPEEPAEMTTLMRVGSMRAALTRVARRVKTAGVLETAAAPVRAGEAQSVPGPQTAA